MKVNIKKSETVHVRNKQRPRCKHELILDDKVMNFTSDYKYLGCWVNEFGNHSKTVDALTAAAGRSFGRIVNMFKGIGNMGYGTYRTLCDSYILPVANYGAAVWGFADYPAPQVLQNRVGRFYLGVHRFAPLAATRTEMDQPNIQYLRWIEMARLYNRIHNMDDHRLPKVILNWDFMSRCKGWLSDLKHVATEFNLELPSMTHIMYDLDEMARTAVSKSRLEWKEEAHNKPKLCTFVKVKDFDNPTCLVKSNLSRCQRSLIAQLLCGILPL